MQGGRENIKRLIEIRSEVSLKGFYRICRSV